MMYRGGRGKVVIAALAAAGCGGQMNGSTMAPALPAIEQITSAEWERLGAARIFFGHQSVGGNLMDGVAEVLAERQGIPLRVVETADPGEMRMPGLYHAPIGRNGEPSSKLSEFRDIVSAGLEDDGTALLKYCYVDVTMETDAELLFEEYRRTVDAMREEQPGVTIVHVTLPLLADPGTLRYVAAVVRGKQSGREVNLIRHRYNELLRQTYEGKEPIFDLAHVESVKPDGGNAAVRYKGTRMPVLASEWTYDGGHLNEAGRRRMAEVFLATLATTYAGSESAP